MQNFDNLFDANFEKTEVTISVLELGEIIGRLIATGCENTSEILDVDDAFAEALITEMLLNFGASIMTEVFGGEFDHLEIEPNTGDD